MRRIVDFELKTIIYIAQHKKRSVIFHEKNIYDEIYKPNALLRLLAIFIASKVWERHIPSKTTKRIYKSFPK